MSNVRILDLETQEKLPRTLRQVRLETKPLSLDLDAVIPLVKRYSRQQRLQYIKQSLRLSRSQARSI